MTAIANAIVKLFEESEVDTYWLFSGFAKLWETKLAHIDKMVMVGLVINGYTHIHYCFIITWRCSFVVAEGQLNQTA